MALVSDDDLPFVANPGVTVWRVLDERTLDRRFLYYWMQTQDFLRQVWAVAGSTDTFPYVSLTQQRKLLVAIPPIDVQRSIAPILRILDDKIELNRRMNETLEAMARAIFQDWFVAFGATRAKIAGCPPYLAADLWALFPDSLDGDCPSGWASAQLLDLCQLKRGYDLPSAQRRNGPVPIVSSSGLSGFHDQAMSEGPGVVTGRYDTVGQVFFVDGPFWPLNTALYVADFKMNNPRFVFHTLRGLAFDVYSDKGAVPGINRNDLHQARVVIAPAPIQAAFAATTDALSARVASNETESETLAATRDLLLPRLMSGELRVKDAERVLAAGA